jgi:tetratricopeptide (TPR) repeat protein
MRKLILLLSCLPVCGLLAQHPEDLNNKGVELMDQEKYAEALPLFDQAIAKDSVTTMFRYNRAVALSNLNRFKEATKDYHFLIRELPDEPEYHFQLAHLYDKLNVPAKAILYYTKAIELDKEDYAFFFQRGVVYLKKNDLSLAVADFTSALKINPESDNSMHNRGVALFKLGKKEQACADWCKAKQLENTFSLESFQKNCQKIVTPCKP